MQYSTVSDFSTNTEVTTGNTSYSVSNLSYNTTYYWRVKATNGNVTSGYCSSRKFKTKSTKYGMPGNSVFTSNEEFVVSPNPASYTAELIFYVDQDQRIELTLYDLNGRQVLNIFDGKLHEDEYIKTINISGLENGMYVAVLKMGKIVLLREIVVLK